MIIKKNQMAFIILIAVCYCFTHCSEVRTLKPDGKLNKSLINESSGIVKSKKWKNVYWTHNDSGDSPRIFPVTSQGKLIQPKGIKSYKGIFVHNSKHIDWEDITSDDFGNLIIGDFGNNKNVRRNLALYFVKEPNPYKFTKAKAYKKIMFYYPEQKQFPPKKLNFDSESLFWANGKLYLLTKHRADTRTSLYRFDSLKPNIKNPISYIDNIDVKNMVTSADVSPNGNMLAILTYKLIWLFIKPQESDNYLKGKSYSMRIKAKQCEGICFDGNKLLISNEQGDLFKIPVNQVLNKD